MLALLGIAAQEPAPLIEPEAQKVFDWMKAKHARLESLECIALDAKERWYPPRDHRLVFRRPNAILVQRRDEKAKVVQEVRAWAGEIVVSSPQNLRGYVRYRPDPKEAYRTSWSEAQNRSQVPLSDLAALLEGRPSTRPSKVVEMRLGERAKSTDGTPVYVLRVGKLYDIQGSPVRWGAEGHDVYQVGIADGIVRRIERRYGVRGEKPLLETAVEFRDVKANVPLSDEPFVFRPAKGMVAHGEWRPAPQDPAAAALAERVRKAMAALDSLSYVAECKQGDDRGTVRFDLKRPWLARGESVATSGSWSRTIVCDGERYVSRMGDGKVFAEGPIGNAEAIASFGKSVWSIPGEQIAQDLARQFFASAQGRPSSFLSACRMGKPVVRNGETFDVLESGGKTNDESGIPTELVSSSRFLIGRKDRLLHAYESEYPILEDGKVETFKTTVRFTRLYPNALLEPELFRIGG